jgi:SAM-dependent methyltransferase
MNRALFITHKGMRCGVYQFGYRLFHDVLRRMPDFDWHYREIGSTQDLRNGITEVRPAFVLANYHDATLSCIEQADRLGIPLLCVAHEVDQDVADKLDIPNVDYIFCADPAILPRNPKIVPVPRFIPAPLPSMPPLPGVFTLGTFGFATPGKGFDQICGLVNQQFDSARIRINIPPHDMPHIITAEMYYAVVDSCRAAITKPGVRLEITNHFLDDAALLGFLAENTINAFAYHTEPGRGISSAADYALASGRAIAVNSSQMFRNFHALNPSVNLDQRPLRDIAESGTRVLEPLLTAYGADNAARSWTAKIRQVLGLHGAPDGRGFNKILDDRARDAYAPSVAEMKAHAPELFARKIPRANIQQAFALETAERLLNSPDLLPVTKSAPRILAIGSYEDTAVATLKAKGWQIEEVDPVINGRDLRDFFYDRQTRLGSYDLILSVSVLEHVEDDAEFVRMISDLLTPGGIAVMTVDFREGYRPSDPKPTVNHRLYTSERICETLLKAIPECALLDRPDWQSGVEDFEYQGCRYAFASLVFRKLVDGYQVRGLLLDNSIRVRLTSMLDDFSPADLTLELRLGLRLAKVLRMVRTLLGLKPPEPRGGLTAPTASKDALIRNFKRHAP